MKLQLHISADPNQPKSRRIPVYSQVLNIPRLVWLSTDLGYMKSSRIGIWKWSGAQNPHSLLIIFGSVIFCLYERHELNAARSRDNKWPSFQCQTALFVLHPQMSEQMWSYSLCQLDKGTTQKHFIWLATSPGKHRVAVDNNGDKNPGAVI